MSNFFDEFYGRYVIKQTVLGTPVEVLQVKVGAGHLGILNLTNLNAAARWVYVIDSAAADAGNIIMAVSLPIGGSFALPSNTIPLRFSLGCRIHSSSAAAFAASGSADLNIFAGFICCRPPTTASTGTPT